MSKVRFVFPKPRLAKLLRMPGGLPVAEALERAQANLDDVRPTCLAELQALLELADAAAAELTTDFDDAGMEKLYAIAVRGVGGGQVCERAGVDGVLTSLCDLIDHLRTHNRYDREAMRVHVRAWRLLMSEDLPDAGREAVIDGLRLVSARYAA